MSSMSIDREFARRSTTKVSDLAPMVRTAPGRPILPDRPARFKYISAEDGISVSISKLVQKILERRPEGKVCLTEVHHVRGFGNIKT